MPEVIHKYTFEPLQEVTRIKMPAGARVLTCQNQHGKICLWAQVNPDESLEKVERIFIIVGTGRAVKQPETHRMNYIATVQLRGGAFVAHIYEAVPIEYHH